MLGAGTSFVSFCFSLDYFVLALFASAVIDLVSSVLCREIGWEECVPYHCDLALCTWLPVLVNIDTPALRCTAAVDRLITRTILREEWPLHHYVFPLPGKCLPSYRHSYSRQ